MAKVQLNEMREGSRIIVRGSWGSGNQVVGVVTDVCKDVKNGIPGVDYTVESTGATHWAYLDQVDQILTY